MTKGTTLILIGIAILLFTPGLIKIFGLICLIIGIIYVHSAKKPNYQDEAQRACGKAAPKRKQDATPPWEK